MPTIPVPEATAVASPEWLNYLNQFRRLAHLPLLEENGGLSVNSQMHSIYMVRNDNAAARSQDPRNPWYSHAGSQAARNGNIFATPQTEAKFDWAINYWMSTPFYAVTIIDPQLKSVGYGDSYDDAGEVKMAAVLDVNSALHSTPVTVTYPIYFPKDGGQTWIIRRSLMEYPDLQASCPGYDKPTGPPIILQIGQGETIPQVTAHHFMQGANVLESCIFDETTYINEDAYAQEIGRAALDERDAIVIIPRRPLQVGVTYTASITVNGETHTWHFEAVARPTTAFVANANDVTSLEMIFIWPLLSRDIYRCYERNHRAADILTPQGSPVFASVGGIVEFAGWRDNGYGNLVILNHGDGVYTLYAHLDVIHVRKGDEVTQMQRIATSGSTGNSDLPHLHFEIIVNYFHRIDPCAYLVSRAIPDPEYYASNF